MTHGATAWARRALSITLALAAAWQLSGCALQPPARTLVPTPAPDWRLGAATEDAAPADPLWWQAIDDPALPRLMAATEAGSPTLALALARIDEARAVAAAVGAAAGPLALASAGSSRGNSSAPGPVTRHSAGLNLAWELDLFGRLAHNRAAAQARLDARDADARSARLSLQSSLVAALLASRACEGLAASQQVDVQSLQLTLDLTVRKLKVGMAPPADVARVQSGLATALGHLAQTRDQCQQLGNRLVAISTLPWSQVQALLATDAPLARPPAQRLRLPGTVLARHPALQAAARTADAAFEDIGQARAARLPSLSLSALLGQQWLGGSSGAQWSLGGTLSGALLDGGAGAANVDASRARHAQAMAQLQSTLLSTVQDVENALSALATAQTRDEQAQAGLAAAQTLFDANQASWRAGRLSLFELEDARRTLQGARSALINARRDRTLAWVDLVKASGNGLAGA